MRKIMLVVLGLLTGCAEVAEFANVQPAVLKQAPIVSNYQDPGADFTKYTTFSVFPLSAITNTESMNAIMEKQVLFSLRSMLELHGYRFVVLQDHPDFVLTARVSSSYSETYVPPQEVSVPVWQPGKVITSQQNTSGTVNLNTYGDYSSNTWGTYSGSSTTTTYVPGHMTAETQVRPGYTIGAFYPAVAVWAYDTKTAENIWYGIGVGASENPDPRISSQFVMSEVLAKLPNCARPVERKQGVTGVQYGILTTDGNNYYPLVFNIPANSPARTAGIHKYDLITAVDGVSVRNKSMAEVGALLGGTPGVAATLQVYRSGQPVMISVTRVDRSVFGW